MPYYKRISGFSCCELDVGVVFDIGKGEAIRISGGSKVFLKINNFCYTIDEINTLYSCLAMMLSVKKNSVRAECEIKKFFP